MKKKQGSLKSCGNSFLNQMGYRVLKKAKVTHSWRPAQDWVIGKSINSKQKWKRRLWEGQRSPLTHPRYEDNAKIPEVRCLSGLFAFGLGYLS